eukprot:CAMPEP_0171217744 /NCGR_PEP_ID=MMETSP0790-20130122/32846_1 /TAXON_ID=2925 /ORGANISM="Alexandrium catenella, Strain OF101" /LENGTH=347 /DNA_ID=CAMNT_0011683549 /DNA_START=6 /DNA_END=1049 /DNA_ORIENTATION=-
MAASPLAVGFMGLGSMGGKMAANLAKRICAASAASAGGSDAGGLVGRRLWLHDVRLSAADAVLAATGEGAARHVSTAAVPSDLALACRRGVVLLCLPGRREVIETVSLLAPHLSAEALVVDCSTCGPEAARSAAEALCSGPGAGFLDAPVTGAPARAASGTLTVMVGGDREHLGRARPLLETFASKVLHVGDAPGNGQLAKALNNCLYNISVAAMAEMLPLAKRTGLDLEPLLEVVSSGTGQSFGFDQWADKAMQREFEAPRHGYPMGAAFKDFESLEAAAAASGLAELPPVLAAARGTYQRALDMGLSNEHKGAMIKVWEEELGVSCARSEGGGLSGPGPKGGARE